MIGGTGRWVDGLTNVPQEVLVSVLVLGGAIELGPHALGLVLVAVGVHQGW